MLAAIKRVFLMRQEVLNLPAVQTINTLLQHEPLLRPLLDADLAELIYDSLCGSTNDQIISYVLL